MSLSAEGVRPIQLLTCNEALKPNAGVASEDEYNTILSPTVRLLTMETTLFPHHLLTKDTTLNPLMARAFVVNGSVLQRPLFISNV